MPLNTNNLALLRVYRDGSSTAGFASPSATNPTAELIFSSETMDKISVESNQAALRVRTRLTVFKRSNAFSINSVDLCYHRSGKL